jgi:3-oxoacyl-(acyl-carrier-protein) synthase III
MTTSKPTFGITGTGAHLPSLLLTNDEVAARFDKPGTWIEEKTGMRQRYVAAKHETTADMATTAARQALQDAGVDAQRVGLVLVSSTTPGRFTPSVACGVQGALGANQAIAMDVSAACAGFMYALHVAVAMLSSGAAKGPALLIGAERFSAHIDYGDRSTAALFGDGAGAVVLDQVPEPYGLRYTGIGSDGGKEDYVRVVRADSASDDPYTLLMDGRAVRGFMEQRFPAVLNEALAATDLKTDDVDVVIPHQANMRLINTILGGAGINAQQVWSTGHLYGNTGAASVPITLDSARRAGRLKDGAVVLLAALGAGMTWGSAVMRWRPIPEQPSLSRA